MTDFDSSDCDFLVASDKFINGIMIEGFRNVVHCVIDSLNDPDFGNISFFIDSDEDDVFHAHIVPVNILDTKSSFFHLSFLDDLVFCVYLPSGECLSSRSLTSTVHLLQSFSDDVQVKVRVMCEVGYLFDFVYDVNCLV